MLVVSRREGECLLLGRDKESIARGEFISLRIVRVKGNVARIGIEATGDVRVLREELFAGWCEEEGVIPSIEPSEPIFAVA